jgi:hypothetical protein
MGLIINNQNAAGGGRGRIGWHPIAVEKLLQFPEFYAPVSSRSFECRQPSVPNPALESRD